MIVSFDDLDTYTSLLHIARRYSVHPSSSLEAEDFFRALLDQYSGDADVVSLEAWLDEQVAKLFVALSDRPRWIQDPEWPFAAGRPMVFVGQIDYQKSSTATVPTPHDDTSFYVFIAQTSPPKLVVQHF